MCGFLETNGRGVWFSIRFSSFLLYSVQSLNCKNCMRLCEFEEIGIARQSEVRFAVSEVRFAVTVNSKEENSEDFCLDFVPEFCLTTQEKSSTSRAEEG